MAYKFDDKFVRFRWSDELKGKKVFYADSVSCLEVDVTTGRDYKELLGRSERATHPFLIDGEYGHPVAWKFVYYDPNYEVKLAYEQGKQIQYKAKDTGNWCDCGVMENLWLDDYEYRIKPDVVSVILYRSLKEGNILPQLCWTDKPVEKEHVYFSGTLADCMDYIKSHAKFAPVMKAWEEGKDIEFCNVGKVWCSATNPTWNEEKEYRIKPEESYLKWTDLRVGDVIESVSSEEGNMKAMVTVIDYSEDESLHVFAGNYWHDDEELKSWRKANADE